METFAGTVRAALVLLSATVAVFGPVLLSETVQVLDALLPNVDGAQEREVSCGWLHSVNVELADPPFRLAETTAN
jgi:hypothetical protein